MHRVAEIRRTRVSGRMDNHERRVVGTEWVVSVQGAEYAVHIDADHDGSTVTFADGAAMRRDVGLDPGRQPRRLMIDGAPLVLKTGKIPGGFRVRTRGADLKVHVRSPRQAELNALMPEKLPPDTSKMLLCPMPGLIVKVDVEVGDEGEEVQEGQALCTVEAMKMENILRAERKGVVRCGEDQRRSSGRQPRRGRRDHGVRVTCLPWAPSSSSLASDRGHGWSPSPPWHAPRPP
jgi:propionyl-CoA carboxylase alpha chain